MTHIIRLIEDHQALDTCACTLAILAESPSPMPETAFDELQKFRHALQRHLHEESRFMQGRSGAGRAAFARHAAAHEDRFADLVAEWEIYLTEWSQEAIGEDWAGFGTATRWMMRRLRDQIKAENEILYPLAVKHGAVRLRENVTA